MVAHCCVAWDPWHRIERFRMAIAQESKPEVEMGMNARFTLNIEDEAEIKTPMSDQEIIEV